MITITEEELKNRLATAYTNGFKQGKAYEYDRGYKKGYEAGRRFQLAFDEGEYDFMTEEEVNE